MTVEQEFLRKKVTSLMKKKKIHIVKMIVRRQDGTKPWGQVARARVQFLLYFRSLFLYIFLVAITNVVCQVGSRLLELLMNTAYIQPPVSQSADGPPDIRPAFRHVRSTGAEDLK